MRYNLISKGYLVLILVEFIVNDLAIASFDYVTSKPPPPPPDPEFLITMDNVTFREGESAILPCAVKKLGTKTVIWKKYFEPNVISIGTLIFPGVAKFKVQHLESKGEWNLIIHNVDTRDSGIYECQISTKQDLLRNVTLNVIDVPESERKPEIHMGGKTYVERGEKILLSCNATGPVRPPDDVDWFKDGNKIRPNAPKGVFITKYRSAETRTLYSELNVDHSRLEDAGTYLCRSTDLEITSLQLIVLNAETFNQKRDETRWKSNSMSASSKRGHQPNSSISPNVNTILATFLILLTLFVNR